MKTAGTALGLAPLISYARPWKDLALSSGEIEVMVRALTDCSREQALEKAVAFLKSGTHWRQLLNAVLVAGSREIKPQPVGFKLHALMVVGGGIQLAEASSPSEQLKPVLFCVDDFKNSQQRDALQGDWKMSPVPKGSFSSKKEAEEALVEALENWDIPGADRALVGLFPHSNRQDIFEILWPYAARDFSNIGHKPIFISQLHFTLGDMPWSAALPVLRSLVHGLLVDHRPRNSKDFPLNLARVEDLRKDWINGKRDHEASLHLLKQLRTADSVEAGVLTAGMLNKGVHPQSLWNGMRLFGSEVLFRSPGLLEVHGATVVNGLYLAFQNSRRERTRAICLLQAASWLTLMRDYLAQDGLSMKGAGLDDLRPDPSNKVTVEAIFQEAVSNHPQAGNMLLGYLKRGGDAAAVMNRMRELLYQKGWEHHQFKYTAAAMMDYGLTDSRFAGHLLAAGLGYLPNLEEEESRIHRRITEVLG